MNTTAIPLQKVSDQLPRRKQARRNGRSVALSTAMTADRELRASRRADTEVFYMAGRQLAALSRRLTEAGWAEDTTVSVVSRAGWPDQLCSEHQVGSLAQACVLHAGRPAVVTVGVGARALGAAARQTCEIEGHQARHPTCP